MTGGPDDPWGGEFRPIPPPPGLTRKQVRLWEQQEQARVARHTGDPAGLTGRARRAYLAEVKADAKQRAAADRAEHLPDRARGLLIVGALVAALLVGSWVWRHLTGTPDPAPPPPVVAGAPTTTAGAATPPAAGASPNAAALTWWAATCPATPDRWPATAANQMTPEAWNAAHTQPPPVVHATWLCDNLQVTPLSGVRADQTILMKFTATRTIITGTTPTSHEPAEDVRTLTLTDGQWLISIPDGH